MTLRNEELVDRFLKGHKKGKAANMEIVKAGHGTAIRGYGFAIYAYRRPDNTIFRFGGWLNHPIEMPGMRGHLAIELDPLSTVSYDVIYRLSDSPESEVHRLNNIPDDTIERLNKGIVQFNGEKVKTSMYNITINPHQEDYEIIIIDNSRVDYGRMWVIPDSLWHFIDPIINDDENKLKFMYELSKSSLNPNKHTHFDLDKLRRVEKQKRKVSEYNEACTEAYENSEIHQIGDYNIFFTLNSVIAVTKDGKCYSLSASNTALGKALVTGKITKSVREKMYELALVEFSKTFLMFDFPREAVEYLPKSVRSYVVKEKLSG